ncbi:unnamed protein product [Protopolystoma xenopodis]|uniref:Uncharacterized protein n=1 Tax=Protopolystoma xenopodis TaxID=117903 RepID=A0A448WAC6_9PLAT|nr:unnamed protein product [Protopolystoma xenopodis]
MESSSLCGPSLCLGTFVFAGWLLYQTGFLSLGQDFFYACLVFCPDPFSIQPAKSPGCLSQVHSNPFRSVPVCRPVSGVAASLDDSPFAF